MPTVSRFFGIVVFLNYREHSPPHFHARYGEDEVTVEIEGGAVMGRMSKRALRLVLERAALHEDDLMRNWNLARESKPLEQIAPLDLMSYPFLHVASVEHLNGHRLSVSFTDGTQREIDLSAELTGPIFAPLLDEAAFAEAYVDPETRTVAWPNGADFAPEFLHTLGRDVAPIGTR